MIGTLEVQSGVLRGAIRPSGGVVGALVNAAEQLVGTTCFPAIGKVDPYNGPYDIIPRSAAQIMPTAGKRMTGDVLVKAIPYYEVSNETGLTVIIGG